MMVFSKLLTVLFLLFNTEGLFGAHQKSSIIGGQDAKKGSWPWMAYVCVTTSTGKPKWICGGSILSSEWVMTAASCFDSQKNPDLRRSMVWIGTHKLRKPSEGYMDIIEASLHPQYQGEIGSYVNNIALLKLKKKMTFSNLVKPIDLPTSQDTFDSASECWITGWGNIRNGVPLSGDKTLQELKIPIISQSDCTAAYPTLTDNVLCAGDNAGGKDACVGDYGGPLVCKVGPKFVQVGIMSYGSSQGCGLPQHPGVYTKVSKYLDFINGKIHRNLEASAED